METVLLVIIIAAIVLIIAYFCPIQQNRYGERLYGRKHLRRAVDAIEEAVFPYTRESEEEVIERKEKSRALVDHIIGVDLLSEQEAWRLFTALFGDLTAIDLGDITVNLLDTDIMAEGEQRTLKFEDARSPTDRIRLFVLQSNMPEFSPGSLTVFRSLILYLSTGGWYDSDGYHPIPGEPTPKDLERIERLEDIQRTFERENEERLIAIRRACDDIIGGKVVYDRERISTLMTWLEGYEKQQAVLRFSRDKEVRAKFLNSAKGNRKRLNGLRRRLKTMRH